jgi:hypothetical protein
VSPDFGPGPLLRVRFLMGEAAGRASVPGRQQHQRQRARAAWQAHQRAAMRGESVARKWEWCARREKTAPASACGLASAPASSDARGECGEEMGVVRATREERRVRRKSACVPKTLHDPQRCVRILTCARAISQRNLPLLSQVPTILSGSVCSAHTRSNQSQTKSNNSNQ